MREKTKALFSHQRASEGHQRETAELFWGGWSFMVSSKFEIQNNSFGDDILSQGLEGHEIILWHSLNNLQIIYPTKICTNYSSGQWVVKIISIKKYHFEKIILERHVALKIICQNIRDRINTHITMTAAPYLVGHVNSEGDQGWCSANTAATSTHNGAHPICSKMSPEVATLLETNISHTSRHSWRWRFTQLPHRSLG